MLILTPEYRWPPDTGGFVRISELLRGLSRTFQTTFIAPYYDIGGIPDISLLNEYGSDINKLFVRRSKLMKLMKIPFSKNPYHCEWYSSVSINSLVEKTIKQEKFDLIFCNFIYSLQYLPDSLDLPVVLDVQNVDREYWGSKARASIGFSRLISLINLKRVKQYEKSHFSNLWGYISVSQEDEKQVKNIPDFRIPNYFVATNGLDIDVFEPINWSTRKPTNEITLAFLGSMDLGMNIRGILYFINRNLPKIRSSRPSITFKLLIIGRNPTNKIKQIAKDDPLVILSGTVPDVQPWLHKADIFIAPLYEGAGTKLKVLEAMGCALPVIGTDVAVRGIGGQDGYHYSKALTDEEFIQSVCLLASSLQKRREIGINGRKFVEDNFSWQIITDKLSREISERIGFIDA